MVCYVTRQHDACDALMTMLSFTPPNLDDVQNVWQESLQTLFRVHFQQQIDTVYACGCEATPDFNEKQEHLDVIWTLPLSSDLELNERQRQQREPVIELASAKSEWSLFELYSQKTPLDVQRDSCPACENAPNVWNIQTGSPQGKLLLLALKRMNYSREHHTTTKIVMKIIPNFEIRAGSGRMFYLRSIIVHRGPNTSAGHYVTYVILSQSSTSGRSRRCYLYNDANVPLVLDGLPEEAYTNSTLLVYSIEAAPEGTH